ncbi:MAG: DUF6893 family small protein [Thermomicrobiales bacterium]
MNWLLSLFVTIVLVAAGAFATVLLPDIRRYLRMRRM